MVASGTVISDLNKINNVFTKLNDAISGIGSSWEGISRDNAEKQINTFINNYKAYINTQMQAFAEALDLYEEYKKIKEQYKVAEEAYLADESNVQKKELMYDLAIQKQKLKEQIEQKLAVVSEFVVSGAEEAPSAKGSMAEEGFTYYTQQGNTTSYAGETIHVAGCAPTSMAMVASYLLDEKITPEETADLSETMGTYSNRGGSSRNFVNKAADEYGLNCEKIENPTVDDVVNALEQGKPIIVRAEAGSRVNGDAWAGSSCGHYLVLTGIDENGNVSVADPWWDRTDQGYKYDPVQIDKAITEAWIF